MIQDGCPTRIQRNQPLQKLTTSLYMVMHTCMLCIPDVWIVVLSAKVFSDSTFDFRYGNRSVLGSVGKYFKPERVSLCNSSVCSFEHQQGSVPHPWC